MKKLQKTFFILLIVSIIIFGIFFPSLDTVSSVNDTPQINSTNVTNGTHSSFLLNNPLQPDQLAVVTILITPQTVNLGDRTANNREFSYMDQTQVSVTALDLSLTDNVNLYVKASAFTSGSTTIDLSNFKYDGFSNSSLPKTQFTGTDAKVKTWDYTLISQTVPVNFYLTVPFGTTPGTYTTTISYTVVVE